MRAAYSARLRLVDPGWSTQHSIFVTAFGLRKRHEHGLPAVNFWPTMSSTLQCMRAAFGLAVLMATLVSTTQVRAQDACGDLANQLAAQDRALSDAEVAALPWLKQASVSSASVAPELAALAASGTDPTLTPQLASTYGALAAQVGGEMDLFASGADAQDSAMFASDLASRLLDWESRLAALQPLRASSPSLSAMLGAVQSLDPILGQAQAALALHNSLADALATCQAGASPLPTLGCGITYFGLDRTTTPPTLRSAVPALPSAAQQGARWDDTTDQTTSEGATVHIVDTYTCNADGASKIGRSAVQTDPDGTTSQWGERDYSGTLWPKTIRPGAAWSWQAVQFLDSDYTETWSVQVRDAGREALSLAQGEFEAIQLHMEEDIVGSDGGAQHYAWDEWYAQPKPP